MCSVYASTSNAGIFIVLRLAVEGRWDTVSQTLGDILTDHKNVFEGLGSFSGEHKIHLKPEVNPVVHPLRKVPIKFKFKFNNALSW